MNEENRGEVAGIFGKRHDQCQIRGCILPAWQTVFLTVHAEWESGRLLEGRIRQSIRTCERHFEDLTHGVMLESAGRPLE